MNYVRLTKGTKDKGVLIKPSEVDTHPYWKTKKDLYTSIHYYNNNHFVQFLKTGTVSGITDVKTDKLVFDFDCINDLEKAREDAMILIQRLIDKFEITPKHLEIFFSGQKGFTIVTHLTKLYAPDQIAHLAINILGKDLQTLDKSLYNASRILRLPNTRHPKSGLFKIYLTFEEFGNMSIDEIKEKAITTSERKDAEEAIQIPDNIWESVSISEKPKEVVIQEVDLSKKPSQWKNCKWSIAQGNFKNGERHTALMVLASTCRGLGFTKDMTYDICKGALRRSIEKHGQGTTDKSDLYKNIIEDSVFTDSWEGGQYTCKKPGWLQDYCNTLGEHSCKDRDIEDKPFVKFDEMFEDFFKFAQDFEKNIIRTGIRTLDDNLILSTSTLNGILGQPGAGKTTMAMNFLKHSSKNGIPSAFFSLDMGKPIVTAKILQQKSGMTFKEASEFVKNQPEEARLLCKQILEEDYANVNFNFKAGLNVNDMKLMVKQHEESLGKKVKLVVVDYLECLAGPYSEAVANTGFIANQLKDFANEMEVCLVLLLQTQKHSTPEISDPLLTMKGVKGASVIEQACTTITTLWREGYSPKFVEDDKYISFAVVKNRFGSLWTGDFSWEPLRGEIFELTEEQKDEFEEFKKRKRENKIKEIQEANGKWE